MGKWARWISMLLLAGCGPALVENDQNGDTYQESDQDESSDDGVVWSGPGWYYGVYFNTEGDYAHWRWHHRSRYDRHGRYYGPYHRGSQRERHFQHHSRHGGGRRHR